jgi:hypothetical protein
VESGPGFSGWQKKVCDRFDRADRKPQILRSSDFDELEVARQKHVRPRDTWMATRTRLTALVSHQEGLPPVSWSILLV